MRKSPQYPRPWALPKTLFGFQQSRHNDIRRGADDVEVTVGAKHQGRWFLPEKMLCDQSRFFSAALRGHFKEAHERKVHFPKEHPDHFAFWLDWLYQGLGPWSTGLLESPPRINQYAEVDLYHLQQLYILGEKLDSREFQSDIINLVYDYLLRLQPPLNFSIETLFRETFPGNDLRRLTTAYIVTVLVEKGALPCKTSDCIIWNPPVTCILGLYGLSNLVCTCEVLFELATEIFEQYGCTGRSFVKLFDCERDRAFGRRWADYVREWNRAREETNAGG